MNPTEGSTCRLSLLLRFLALLLFASVGLPSSAHAESRKQLLVLHSYSQGYKWTDDTSKGIVEALQNGDSRVKVHYEYMDTKRASDADYFQLLFETYRAKFRYTRFDAVISADSDALHFLKKYRDQLFPGIPIIFSGVYNFQPAMLEGAQLITGVNEVADFRATLDLALKLHPTTRQIVVINDTTSIGRAVHKDLLEVLPAYRGKVKFRFIEDVYMQEVLETVQKLPADALVLYTLFLRDKSKKTFDYDESISLIAQRCPVPIYGVWDFNLGYGIVGGKLISGYYQGRQAGEMALRILGGEPVDKIPVVMKSLDHYMFDYRQLRRFDIEVSSLPEKSIFINRPANFYTMNQTVFWSAVGVLACLLLIIMILVVNMQARKKAEHELRLLAQELDRRVTERTAELELKGTELQQQNDKLQEVYLVLQSETSERVLAVEELRRKDQMLIQQGRMAAIGEMLGNIAHQWRQPLNLLGLTIQEVDFSQRREAVTPEFLIASMGKAMELIQHMSRTIDDFRIFSTPDREKVCFSVNELISRIISLLDGNFRGQGVVIEVESTGDKRCCGYPNGYGQVILNLLLNARDAIQERAVQDGRIQVRSWQEGERTVLTVTDNAGGIEEAIIDKIFDPYFTTKESGKGTGIGLFMSKALVEKSMGGELTVRNVGQGAEFRVEMACVPEETQAVG